jgi:hypothetical protein
MQDEVGVCDGASSKKRECQSVDRGDKADRPVELQSRTHSVILIFLHHYRQLLTSKTPHHIKEIRSYRNKPPPTHPQIALT